MVFKCAVPNCQTTPEIDGISLHKFPDSRTLKKAWIAKIFNDAGLLYKDLGMLHVCSIHFTPDDYELLNAKQVLKKNAKPSLFMPKPSKKSESLGKSFSPKKKRKLEKANSSFENLPSLVLEEVFSYLNYNDRCNAAVVCCKWHDASRSPSLWKKVHVKVKTSLHLLKFLLQLPSSVTLLNIYCDYLEVHKSLYLLDIMCRLHECCPNIETVVFENVFFAQRFCNAKLTTDHLLHSPELVASTFTNKKWPSHENLPQCLKECCDEKISRNKYIPDNRPKKLTIFSLRYAHSFMSHLSSQISQFLPEVKVLDLTSSATIKTAAVPFFLKLICLEELYLTRCPITNSGIKSLLQNLNGLKVLDLEGSLGADDETFQILQNHGQSLKELFLGNTQVKFATTVTDVDAAFPNLQTLCLKNTFINISNFSSFVQKTQSLKYIDINCAMFGNIPQRTEFGQFDWILNGSGKNIKFGLRGYPTELCHHFKRKYM